MLGRLLLPHLDCLLVVGHDGCCLTGLAYDGVEADAGVKSLRGEEQLVAVAFCSRTTVLLLSAEAHQQPSLDHKMKISALGPRHSSRSTGGS